MNLVPVTPPRDGQTLQCYHCGKMKAVETMMADLDGEPFVAYYCQPCAKEVTQCTNTSS